MKKCIICGNNAEEHHIVFRSQNATIIKSPKNIIYLCEEHHRGKYGPHGKLGREKDLEYKIKLQNELFSSLSQYPGFEEIQKVLKINDKQMYKLLKTVKIEYIDNEVRYSRENVIRAIMGGKLYFED